MTIGNKIKTGIFHDNFMISNLIDFVHKNEQNKLCNKNKFLPKVKAKVVKTYLLLFSFISFLFLSLPKVYAVDKLEGGTVTISDLEKKLRDLAIKGQVLGIVVAFVAIVIFLIQFIVGDDEMKQRRKKTILYTFLAIGVLILVPSIINFIIDTLG